MEARSVRPSGAEVTGGRDSAVLREQDTLLTFLSPLKQKIYFLCEEVKLFLFSLICLCVYAALPQRPQEGAGSLEEHQALYSVFRSVHA